MMNAFYFTSFSVTANGAGGDEETLAEVASEATEDGTASTTTAVRAIQTAYSPKKEAAQSAVTNGDASQDLPAAMETDGFGDAGEEAKERGDGSSGGGGVEGTEKVEDAEKLDAKVEDVDEVLKELMLYADMASRDCQPFLTRHAYVHRFVKRACSFGGDFV